MARTIVGIVHVAPAATVAVLTAASLTAVGFTSVTTRRGLPTSASVGLVGGLACAGLSAGGERAVEWGGLVGTRLVGVLGVLIGILLAPFLAAAMAGLVDQVARRASCRLPRAARRGLHGGLWLASAAVAIADGANDGQKAMGLLAVAVSGGGSLAATGAFLEASAGRGAASTLTALEHDADQARRALLAALRGALATPIDQEDLYILSERRDRVVNAVRDMAVGSDTLAWKPDRHAALMAGDLYAAMTALVDGVAKLRQDSGQAGVVADQARAQARTVVRRYREAIADLYRGDDLQAAVTGREPYRPYARAADLLEAVAHRPWHVVLADA